MPGLLSCDDFFFQNCSDHFEMETKRLTEFTVADEAMMNYKFKINTKLLPIKAHYFLCYAAAAPVVPFVPIYAKQNTKLYTLSGSLENLFLFPTRSTGLFGD